MITYRRNRLPGGTYFFTATLRNRRSQLLVAHIDLLRQAFRHVRYQRPFETLAIVVMPDHIHAIWALPETDDDYPARWRAIKSHFTRALVGRGIPLTRNQKGEYALWQRRYWEHTIRDEKDLQRHVDYIHYNPVKHRRSERVSDWPYSSFHRYVRKEWLNPDWGDQQNIDDSCNYGE